MPFKPLMQVIAWTCPECEENEERYPLTLLSAFIWLAVLSALLSAVVTRWGELLSVPTATMGMLVVAVGAQVPDTIQAMAVGHVTPYLTPHIPIYRSRTRSRRWRWRAAATARWRSPA